MQPGGANDGDQHDVRPGECGECKQPFRAEVDFHVGRQQGAEFRFFRGIVNRDMTHARLAGLGGELFTIPTGGQRDDFDLVQQLSRYLERRATDGTGGS